ncbi:MAG: 3-phosphoshikimate 1-carboxyvinyltransferase [Acidimicrobiia bacterium]|nr:3-phosphoshikimate 1-carboxyvinyltransferase [Acidimicrobiia bacterium]
MKRISPSGPVAGTVRLPGSKSITNRALLVAALASGESRLVGALRSDDTEAMIDSLSRLGVAVTWDGYDLIVAGSDGSLGGGDTEIDVRGSGTTARFLTAACTVRDGTVVVDGNRRMRQRPIGDLVRALGELGAAVEVLGEEDRPPVRVHGPALTGGAAILDASRSSQFASAVLMVAPCADGDTVLELREPIVSRPYIDQTLEVMRAFGAEAAWDGPTTLTVAAGGYAARDFIIEGDASAAAYPLVAAAVCGGSVRVGPLPEGSLQADLGLIPILERMGAEVRREGDDVILNGHPQTLAAVSENMNDAPDAVVALAVAALFAGGETRLTDIANLRIKESNRMEDLAMELRKLGGIAATGPDFLVVEGGELRAATIDPHDDHRMAMSFAVAGLRIPGVEIEDPECVAKTWPGFFAALESITTPLIIAVDGPGGVGKSTVSQAVAGRFGLGHLETGGMYRAGALAVLEAGIDIGDEAAVAALIDTLTVDVVDGRVIMNGTDVTDVLRTEAVSTASSRVSAVPRVREALVALQRRWVRPDGGGAVVEGRDIGTVVFPDSPAKVYLTARPDVRAIRRVRDLGLSEDDIPRIAADLAARDERDSTRAVSPLRPADDALILDTSDMPIEQVIDTVARFVIDRGRHPTT